MIASEVRFTHIEHKSADFSHQKGKRRSRSQSDGLRALDSPKRSVDGFRYRQILSQLEIFRVDQIPLGNLFILNASDISAAIGKKCNRDKESLVQQKLGMQ